MGSPGGSDRSAGVVRASILALTCGVLFVATYVLTVLTVPGRRLGDASLQAATLAHPRFADVVDRILNVISAAGVLAAVVVILVIALARLRRVAGLAALGLLVGANASTRLLKSVVLTRPDLGLHEVTPATLNSLPSGHSTAVFSVVAALLLVLPRSLRTGVAVVGAVASSLVALATMSAGWHRAGDSLAAFLLVGVWAGLATTTMWSIGDTDVVPSGEQRARSIRPRWVAFITAALLTSGVALVLLLLADEALRASTVGPAAAFTAGGLLICGTAVAVLAALVRVLDQRPHRGFTKTPDPAIA